MNVLLINSCPVQRMMKVAIRNGFLDLERGDYGINRGNLAKQKKRYYGVAQKIYLGSEEQRGAAQLAVRLLATLEMVVKDPDADIVVREGNRDDFKAALQLFEKITLPRYFKIIFEEDLFDDYNDVEPYPSW